MSSFTTYPMLTPHDDTVIAWQQACTQAADALRPQHDRERLAKALALAHEGAITLGDDGAALVTSHGTQYRIDADGLCHCPDAHHRGLPCKHLIALQIHRQATASLATSTPSATPPVTAPTERPPSADRWAVTEAPASCCMRLHIGELELMYTMRDVTDTELTSRVQHLVPWVQDVFDQARERQGQLDTLRQQRDAAAAGQAAVPPPPPRPTCEPSDRHAGPDSAGGAAGPGRAGGRQQGPARCPQPGPRPHSACQPGRLVRASPGGDGAPQQCEGHVVESLAGGRGALVSGEIATQGTGRTPGARDAAVGQAHPSSHGVTQHAGVGRAHAERHSLASVCYDSAPRGEPRLADHRPRSPRPDHPTERVVSGHKGLCINGEAIHRGGCSSTHRGQARHAVPAARHPQTPRRQT